MAEYYQAKQNKFYSEDLEYIDYKDVKTLQHYVNSVGKIDSRRRSGASMKHQRMIAKAIKRARHIGLLPFVVK